MQLIFKIFKGRIKIIGHFNQPLGAPELRMWFYRFDGHQLYGLLVVGNNENLLPSDRRMDQIEQFLLSFINLNLCHGSCVPHTTTGPQKPILSLLPHLTSVLPPFIASSRLSWSTGSRLIRTPTAL